MILPKELFDKIEYWEHTTQNKNGWLYDVFTVHFRQWWRRKRSISIAREMVDYDSESDTASYRITPSAADLYNQLNKWAIQTWDEKLDSVKRKYEKDETGNNVIYLKQKPKDMNE